MNRSFISILVCGLHLSGPASAAGVGLLQDSLEGVKDGNLKAATVDSTKQAAAESEKKKTDKPSVADKTKSSRKFDGLYTLYQDTAPAGLQLYVAKGQIGKDFIYQ